MDGGLCTGALVPRVMGALKILPGWPILTSELAPGAVRRRRFVAPSVTRREASGGAATASISEVRRRLVMW